MSTVSLFHLNMIFKKKKKEKKLKNLQTSKPLALEEVWECLSTALGHPWLSLSCSAAPLGSIS